MSNEPLVTIAIPFYNSEKTLLDAIKSILCQTFEDWELLLVDDGSSDGSLEIARSVQNVKVKVFSDGKNLGLPGRLNMISRMATGKYLARMDADDLSAMTRIEKQITFLEENPDIDVLGTDAWVINENSDVVSRRVVPRFHNEIFASRFPPYRILHPTIVGKREWFLKNPYNEFKSRCEDNELWMRTKDRTRFANLNEPLFFYRERQDYSVKAYAHGKILFARTMWRYSRQHIGTWRALIIAVSKCVHIAIFSILKLIGFHAYLLKRRSSAVNSAALLKAQTELEQIMKTEV